MRYADRSLDIQAALRDLSHSNSRVRLQAADALGSAEAEDAQHAMKALRPLLQDDGADMRYTAALSLGELGDNEALDALIEQMEGDGNPMVRQAAVIALGMIGDPRVAPRLAEALRQGPPEVRFQAATSLVQVDPQTAAGPLRRALRDEDAEVRGSAVAALGEVEGDEQRQTIATLLEDPAPSVRLEAALTLARLGDRTGASVLLLHLEDRDQRHIAAEHLYRCPSEEAAPALRRLLERWRIPPLIKVWAAGALSRLGDEVGRRALLSLLSSRRLTVRGLSIQVLGEIGEPWALAALRDLAASPTGERWLEEIAEALGERSGEPVPRR